MSISSIIQNLNAPGTTGNPAPVPVLSAAGWVSAIKPKADALISHFFESQHNQTYLYGENVSSLTYILAQYGNDALRVTQNLRQTLERYLGSYYTSVIVDVSNDAGPSNTTNQISLTVYISVTDNTGTYSLGKQLTYADSKIQTILDLNNYGTTNVISA